MNSTIRTVIYIVIAVAFGAVAWLSKPSPRQLDYFSDQGELFYPEFTDPLEAASLEVISYDEESGTARPFKVQVKDGRWSIPSHYDYPADGEDQLAKTAASMIGLKRDVVQSDRAQDHEELGVIDPLDDSTPSLRGRGTRVVLRDESGAMLADYIVGKRAEGKEGFRYVRLPGKKRSYAINVGDVELSTRFADWIETDLLGISSSEIQQIQIHDYSIDEQSGTVQQVDTLVLAKGDDNDWTLQQLPPGRELDRSKVNQMTSALSRLTITGVRPKPDSLTADLRMQEGIKLDLPTQLSLQGKGFFVTGDGALLSNEGEVRVGMTDGVRYTLRFGEVLFGEGLEVSAGIGEEEDAQAGSAEGPPPEGTENRYLFVTASFDESLLPPRPERPVQADEEEADEADEAGEAGGAEEAAEADEEVVEPDAAEEPGIGGIAGDVVEEPGAEEESPGDETGVAMEQYEQELAQWQAQVDEARARVEELNDRFAPWYYVISGQDFQNIRLNLEKLTKEPQEQVG